MDSFAHGQISSTESREQVKPLNELANSTVRPTKRLGMREMDPVRLPAKSRRAHQCYVSNADREISSLRGREFRQQLYSKDRISFTFLET